MFILVVYYHLMCFTPFIEAEQQHVAGYSVVFVVSAHLIYSILFIILTSFKRMLFKLRLWWLLRKLREQREAMRLKFACRKVDRENHKKRLEARMLAQQLSNFEHDIESPSKPARKSRKSKL
jgi:hypothetical protein